MNLSVGDSRSSRWRNANSESVGMGLCRVAGIDTLLREIVIQGAFGNPHDLADFHDAVLAFLIKA